MTRTRICGPARRTTAKSQMPMTGRRRRKFALERAVMMDRLFNTIANPYRVFPAERPDRHVYLSSPPLPDGGSYVVALEKSGLGTYKFVSVHPRSKEYVASLKRGMGVAPNGAKV